MSLLYRAALGVVTRRAEIPHSATEGECVAIVSATSFGPRSVAADFSDLTGAWVRTAYGDRPPDRATFRALSERWAAHLAEGAGR